MSSDGQRENDQAGDDEKNSSDERPRQKKITFQGLLGVSPEEFKQFSESIARVVNQLPATLSGEHLIEFQKQQAEFARTVELGGAQLALVGQMLAEQASEAQQLGVLIGEHLLAMREEYESNVPSQEVLAAAFTHGYRRAQESEPVIRDEKQAMAFIDKWFSSTWERLVEKGFHLAKKEFYDIAKGILIAFFALRLHSSLPSGSEPQVPTLDQHRVVVKEEAKLHVNPDDSTEAAALLQAGQDVEVFEESEEWVQVRFFDEASETYNIGWVRKGYLLPLDTSD